MSRPTDKFQLDFLAYIQRLMDEGDFSATYKYALMMSLADLSIEKGDDTTARLRLHSKDIAAKFVQYYWRQSQDYVSGDAQGILYQNKGRQAAVVNLVRQTRLKYGGMSPPPEVIAADGSLIRDVAHNVQEMPLWRLQTLGRERVPFLYANLDRGPWIELNEGIAFCFRRFHGLIIRLAQNAWTEFVRTCQRNAHLVGEHVDISAFLFGTERANLNAYRPVLRDIQRGSCFYCRREVREWDVDHFIPWSRYPHDLGHNFVLACKPCNNKKRDMLAEKEFRNAWQERNMEYGPEMSARFSKQGLPHDLETSTTITAWAYQHAVINANAFWGPGQ